MWYDSGGQVSQSAKGQDRRIGVIGHGDSPVRKASTNLVGGRTIKANRLKRFKSIGLSFWMLPDLAHAA